MNRPPVLFLAMAGLLIGGWLDSTRDRVTDGNRQYAAGKYDEATQRYGEALVDDPESPRLNFNMGTARYKAGKYDEAVAAFERVRPAPDDPKREARAAYNIGNAHYRRGAAIAAEKPQDALAAFAAALASYRHALGIDPTDIDTKFNYELVSRKLDELRKRLETQQQDKKKSQQQQQQQQQQDQQEEQQEHGEQKDQEQQQADQQTGDQQQKQQPPTKPDQPREDSDQSAAQQQAAQQPAPEKESGQEGQQQADQQDAGGEGAPAAGKQDDTAQPAGDAGGAATAGSPRQLSPADAAALLDAARGDELRPDEFARRVQGAAVAEPSQDW